MTRPARPLALAAAILATALVSGCGKLGDLERPGALAGQPAAPATPAAKPQDPSRPVSTVDPRDPAALQTPRQ